MKEVIENAKVTLEEGFKAVLDVDNEEATIETLNETVKTVFEGVESKHNEELKAVKTTATDNDEQRAEIQTQLNEQIEANEGLETEVETLKEAATANATEVESLNGVIADQKKTIEELQATNKQLAENQEVKPKEVTTKVEGEEEDKKVSTEQKFKNRIKAEKAKLRQQKEASNEA